MNQQKCCQQQSHIVKAQKICISPQCTINSPLICQACEQLHQHNGTILAVRINKIKQISKKKGQDTNIKRKIKIGLSQIKQKINTKIDQIIQSLDQNGDAEGDKIQKDLEDFLQGRKTGKFLQVWEKAKSSVTTISNNKQSKSVQSYKIELARLILPQNNNIVQSTTSDINLSKDEQFLQQISSILCHLSLQIKLLPNSLILQELKNINPKTRPTHLILAKLLQITNQSQQALNIYEKILTQNPLDIQIITYKALLLKKCKKYQKAYEQLTLLIDLIGGRASTDYYRFCKGQVCRMLGKYEQAISQFKKCKQKQGNNWAISKQMGFIYFKQNNYKQAIQIYKNAIQNGTVKHEEFQQIYQNLYQSAKQLSDFTLALDSLNKLYKLNPSNIQTLFKRARINHQLKQYQSAIQDYNIAIRKAGNIPGLYYNRAVQLIYSGKSEQSIPDLKKAIQLDPNFKQAVHLLANTCFDLLQKGQTAELADHLRNLAINSYGYSLNFYKDNENIWHNLGILQTQKNPQKAYQFFCQALKINPKLNASYLGKIKTAILLQKDKKIILNDVIKLINQGDRSLSTFLIKCSLQVQIGLFSQAQQTVNLIFKADSKNKQALQLKNSIQNMKNKNKNQAIDQTANEQYKKQQLTNNNKQQSVNQAI